MPVRWNVDKIDNYMETCWRLVPETFDEKRADWHTYTDEDGKLYRLRLVTEHLIATCSFGEMGRITEANVLEFYLRVCAWEAVQPNSRRFRFDDGRRHYIDTTFDEVKAHIGLSTNWTTTRWATWFKRVRDTYKEDSA